MNAPAARRLAQRQDVIVDMLMSDQITQAGLADWRKLAQGLHARFVVTDLSSGAAFVAAIVDALDDLGDHLRISLTSESVDLRLMSDDAIYREDDGTEHIVQWVTQEDIELLWKAVEESPGTEVTVDLERQLITCGSLEVGFQIDGYTRWRLMEGLDDISLTLQHEQAITDFEARRPRFKPRTLPART